MKLYFKNYKGKLKVIARPTNMDECYAEIRQFLADRNYKSYYYRRWKNSDTGRIIIDYGSHVEFFEIDEEE